MRETVSSKLLSGLFYRTWGQLGDAMLPRRCVACHTGIKPKARSTNEHALARYICGACFCLLENSPKVRCKRCGLALGPRPQAFGWTHCWRCKPFALEDKQTNCTVCCDYIAPFDQWIAQLKYGQAHGLAKFMGTWLGMTVANTNTPMPDLLIPVPNGPKKLKQRGYNQAALIARYAGRYLNRPVMTDWLVKIREAESQAELDRAGRLSNLQGVFLAKRAISPNLKIGLIDDVITTGATVERCLEALRKAGAKSIVTMAVCRTPE